MCFALIAKSSVSLETTKTASLAGKSLWGRSMATRPKAQLHWRRKPRSNPLIPRTITAGNSNGGLCAQDPAITTEHGEVITHCKISDIKLSGQGLLEIDSTAGPVRLYINGDVALGGQAGIRHIQNGVSEPKAGRLSLYGNPRDDSGTNNQTVMLSGVSSLNPKRQVCSHSSPMAP